MSIATEITRLQNAKASIKTAIEGKGGTVASNLKLDGYASCISNIPTSGVTPTGTINITTNGTHDVSQYASANVNVPTGGTEPSLGTKSITANGTYMASDDSFDGYSQVTVNVPTGSTPTGTKQISITTNGTTTDDVTNYASVEITVNVSGGGGISIDDFASGSAPNGDITLSVNPRQYAFADCYNLRNVKFTGTTHNATAVYQNSSIEIFVATNVTTLLLNNAFNNCSNFKTIDINGASSIGNLNVFRNCSSFDTMIIRNSAVPSLYNTSTFNASPFADGGTGGTLYVPQSLISSYQSATNWSTILGYANNSIQAIEGSQYENYYADGTPISTS